MEVRWQSRGCRCSIDPISSTSTRANDLRLIYQNSGNENEPDHLVGILGRNLEPGGGGGTIKVNAKVNVSRKNCRNVSQQMARHEAERRTNHAWYADEAATLSTDRRVRDGEHPEQQPELGTPL